ncbi:MAG: hypothetical protein ACRDNO_15165 [Trebonia sp.]
MTTDDYEKAYLDDVAEGRAILRAIAKARGRAKAKAEAVLRILDLRGIATSREQRELVTASADLAQLDLWFDRAANASTAAEVFAE